MPKRKEASSARKLLAWRRHQSCSKKKRLVDDSLGGFYDHTKPYHYFYLVEKKEHTKSEKYLKIDKFNKCGINSTKKDPLLPWSQGPKIVTAQKF
jgi:hypothetical protein